MVDLVERELLIAKTAGKDLLKLEVKEDVVVVIHDFIPSNYTISHFLLQVRNIIMPLRSRTISN